MNKKKSIKDDPNTPKTPMPIGSDDKCVRRKTHRLLYAERKVGTTY